jgi:hypothetical protein
MSGQVQYGFENRAKLYAAWDRQLGEKTRFFAAASVTNHVLAGAVRLAFPKRLSHSAATILGSLGDSLEISNRQLAKRVLGERRSGVHLDERMVEVEQSLVERFLERTADAEPNALRQAIAEYDVLLNLQAPWSICGSVFPGIGGYLAALRRVRGRVGPPLRFVQLAHRILIGQQLIAGIREGIIATLA